MCDPGGGGRRPSPELQTGGCVGSLPAVGLGGRSHGGSSGLLRGSDGRFLSSAMDSQSSLVEAPGKDVNMVSLHDAVNSQDVNRAVFVDATGTDEQMVEAKLPQGNATLADGFTINNLLGFSPPLPTDFSFGSCQVQQAKQASHPCRQGVCVNSQPSSKQVLPTGLAAGGPVSPGSSSSNVWQRPKVIPLPSVADLGQFSCDGSTALLDNVEVAATVKKFDLAIVGRLFGKRIPYSRLSNELRLRWASYGGFKLVTMSSDCFVCFFESLAARDAVLLGGPWVVFGQVLGIDRWTPEFSPSSSVGFCTPVWIRLPCLPLYCWSPRNIGRILALVGEPLWIDSATDQFERGLYARACVRLNLSKPLKSGVWVDGCHGRFFQPLEYEGLSVFCCRCGQIGHKEFSCKQIIGRIQSPKQPTNVVPGLSQCHDGEQGEPSTLLKPGSVASPSSSPVNVPSGEPPSLECSIEVAEDRGVGPWMMVTRKKRPSKISAARPSLPPSVARDSRKWVPSSSGKNGGQAPSISPAKLKATSLPSRSPSLAGVSHKPLLNAANLVLVDSIDSVIPGNAIPENMEDKQLVLFSAQPKGGKERPSKPYVEKMLTDLGPIALGTRKKRKQIFISDGGDASSLKPP